MRTVVITGSNVGIGFASAKFLAAIPDWHVVLACRNELKANAAIREIKQMHPHAHLSFVPLDLFSLASVRRFPESVSSKNLPPLTAVLLNPGGTNMKAKSHEFTQEGFERTFEWNFLGQLLMGNRLSEQMSMPARIGWVSSEIHETAATKMGK